jgi:uncharacterized delta-60 repeat protein
MRRTVIAGWDGERRPRVRGAGPTVVALVAALMAASAGTTSAAPGDLDPTFAGDGSAIVDLGARDQALGVVIQADGKIVTAGQVNGSNTAVVRLNLDGTLDTTFAGDGSAVVDLGNVDQAFGVAGHRGADQPVRDGERGDG